MINFKQVVIIQNEMILVQGFHHNMKTKSTGLVEALEN